MKLLIWLVLYAVVLWIVWRSGVNKEWIAVIVTLAFSASYVWAAVIDRFIKLFIDKEGKA